jgi:hypothetical protein
MSTLAFTLPLEGGKFVTADIFAEKNPVIISRTRMMWRLILTLLSIAHPASLVRTCAH